MGRDRVMHHPRLPKKILRLMCQRRKEKFLEWRKILKTCPWPPQPLEVAPHRPRKNVKKRIKRINHLKVVAEKRKRKHMKNLTTKKKKKKKKKNWRKKKKKKKKKKK